MIGKFNEEDLSFMRRHADDDPLTLSLKYHNSPHKKSLIAQLGARRKLRKKLPEWVANEQIQFPPGLPLEQASSELTAQLKASLIRGDSITDLTGGLGVDCYYLSKSFNHTKYVDCHEGLVDYARYNFSILGADIDVIKGKAEDELVTTDSDVIYLDPHRRGEGNRKQFLLDEHEPNVLDMLHELAKDGRKTLIKTSPMLDISQAIQQLQQVTEVWIISVANDCKEVVYLLTAKGSESPLLRTWNYNRGKWQYFEGRSTNSTRPDPGDPLRYLYEPNASVFKAGLQDQVALDFGLKKLHPNSHVYSGNELQSQFPGRIYEIGEVLKPWDKRLKGGAYKCG